MRAAIVPVLRTVASKLDEHFEPGQSITGGRSGGRTGTARPAIVALALATTLAGCGAAAPAAGSGGAMSGSGGRGTATGGATASTGSSGGSGGTATGGSGPGGNGSGGAQTGGIGSGGAQTGGIGSGGVQTGGIGGGGSGSGGVQTGGVGSGGVQTGGVGSGGAQTGGIGSGGVQTGGIGGGGSGSGGVQTGGVGSGGAQTGGSTTGGAGGTATGGAGGVQTGGSGSGGAQTGGSGGGGSGSGGATGAGGGPADPLNAAPTCTSGVSWQPADGNSQHMRPGEGCGASSCHGPGAGPLTWTVSGTVYPTGHEPDDCNGFNNTTAGNNLVHVVITDATGMELTLLPNDVGNFYLSQGLPVTFPLHAKVTVNSSQRAMSGAVDTGDCNSCHTQNGATGAPGRITVPAP